MAVQASIHFTCTKTHSWIESWLYAHLSPNTHHCFHFFSLRYAPPNAPWAPPTTVLSKVSWQKNHQQRHEHTNRATSLPFGYVLAKRHWDQHLVIPGIPSQYSLPVWYLMLAPPYIPYQARYMFLKAEIGMIEANKTWSIELNALRFFQQFLPQFRILVYCNWIKSVK